MERKDILGDWFVTTDVYAQTHCESQIAENSEDYSDDRFNIGIPFIVWFFDCEGKILKCVGDGLSNLGVAAEDLYRKTIFECISRMPHTIDKARLALSGEYIAECVKKDNQAWVNWYYPIRNLNYDVAGSVCLSINISHHLQQMGHMIAQLKYQAQSHARNENRHYPLTGLQANYGRTANLFELTDVLCVLLDQVVKQMRVDAGRVFICDIRNTNLRFLAEVGFNSKDPPKLCIKYGDGLAGQVALRRRPYIAANLLHPGHKNLLKQSKIHQSEFMFYCGFPLIFRGCLHGVLELFNRQTIKLNKRWLDSLKEAGDEFSIRIYFSGITNPILSAKRRVQI